MHTLRLGVGLGLGLGLGSGVGLGVGLGLGLGLGFGFGGQLEPELEPWVRACRVGRWSGARGRLRPACAGGVA